MFGALALRFLSSLFSYQPGSHMSWVKQKKILNCLLFLFAATGKWSGERQMSLSPWMERQTAYKALLPLPVPVCVHGRSSPWGDCLKILSDQFKVTARGQTFPGVRQNSEELTFLLLSPPPSKGLITLSTKLTKWPWNREVSRIQIIQIKWFPQYQTHNKHGEKIPKGLVCVGK